MLLKSLERFMWDGCQLSVEAFIWLVLLVSFSENLPAFSEEMHGPSVMHVAFSEYYIYIYALHESAHMQYTSHTCHMRFYIYEKPRLGMLCRSCVWWSFLLGKEMCGEPVGPAQHLRLGLMLPTMLLLMVNKMPLTSYQVQEWGTPLSWKLLAAFLTFECFVWI